MGSMPLYAALPALTEAVVEAGWTRAYARIADVGLPRYLAYFGAYMACVEFFVYWMHRGLHDVKLGYRRGPASPALLVALSCLERFDLVGHVLALGTAHCPARLW